jgi:hypothetical protein
MMITAEAASTNLKYPLLFYKNKFKFLTFRTKFL